MDPKQKNENGSWLYATENEKMGVEFIFSRITKICDTGKVPLSGGYLLVSGRVDITQFKTNQ